MIGSGESFLHCSHSSPSSPERGECLGRMQIARDSYTASLSFVLLASEDWRAIFEGKEKERRQLPRCRHARKKREKPGVFLSLFLPKSLLSPLACFWRMSFVFAKKEPLFCTCAKIDFSSPPFSRTDPLLFHDSCVLLLMGSMQAIFCLSPPFLPSFQVPTPVINVESRL